MGKHHVATAVNGDAVEFLCATQQTLPERNPDPSEEEVRYGLAGNLRRCTGYHKIVDAVLDAAREMRGA